MSVPAATPTTAKHRTRRPEISPAADRPARSPARATGRRWYRRWAAATGLVTAMSLAATTVSQAAAATPLLTLNYLSASVHGGSVATWAKVSAAQQTTASRYGVCVRSASGNNLDYPKVTDAILAPTGTAFTASKTFAAGTYTYFACVKLNEYWYHVGAAKTFTVDGSTMPTGSPAGWKQVFAEDFNTPQAMGQFPGDAYGARWTSYNGFYDFRGIGFFDPARVISVHDGALDMYLHTANGIPLGAAPVPLVNGKWGGQIYGRYSVRFKADSLAHFGLGWLLWPDSGNWNEGEIDFPEGGLSGTIHGYTHCINDPSKNCAIINTNVAFASGWHTTTVEWTPGQIKYILDGNVLATTGNSPTTKMHWVLQTATTGIRPDVSTQGHVLIDWVTIDARS